MITYHHIGGRNGTYPLPLKKGPLLQDFHLILYDADTNCFDQMKQTVHSGWGKVDVYPYCIGGQTGRSQFHLNFHPTTNSLYPFNDEFKDYNMVHNPLYGEYVFGDACQHMRSVELELYSLEDALTASNIPSIDFLSLDVQGAEYDILNGATGLLQRDCIGVQLEVEFVKLYQGQKTFSDINVLMESLGFELLELGSFGRCAPMSLPIGFRGLEQPLYAEAVYIKKLSRLDNHIEQLYKGALFSLMYKKLGLCLKFLSKIADMGQIGRDNPRDGLFNQCLADIWAVYEASQHIKLPKLSQLFSNERFQNYYGQKEVVGTLELQSVQDMMQGILPTVTSMRDYSCSPLEKILRQYELSDVADAVRENRDHETNCFLELNA